MPIGFKKPGIGDTELTPEGGLAIWLENQTGGPSIKGYIVEPSTSVDGSVIYTGDDDIDPIGVVYDDGVSIGERMRVVVSGIADVYYGVDVNRGTFSRVPVAADGLSDGQAMNEPLPVSPFATDKHFQEIGHPLESRIGPGLARTVLHFN